MAARPAAHERARGLSVKRSFLRLDHIDVVGRDGSDNAVDGIDVTHDIHIRDGHLRTAYRKTT